jgi:type II secretory pathway component PulJ
MSLLELMIAMALGLVLMSGLLQLYVHYHQVEQQQQMRLRVQETGRFLINHLSREVRAANAIHVDPDDACLVVETREVDIDDQVITRFCIQHRNNDPGNPPSLYMHRVATASAPALNAALVDGVAELSVLYGIGTEGDAPASVTAWLTGEQVTADAQIVSVRIATHVIPAYGDVDGQADLVFSTTVTPRNTVLPSGGT